MADATIVVDIFKFIPEADENGLILEIEGRNKGLTQRILSLLKIEPRSYMQVSRRDVKFKFSNLSGVSNIVCPLNAVTCSVCGVHKPLRYLIFGILLILFGLVSLFGGESGAIFSFFALIIGIGLTLYYVLTTHLTITFSTGEIGNQAGLDFTAQTSKGQTLTVDNLLEVVNFINHHMVDVQSKE